MLAMVRDFSNSGSSRDRAEGDRYGEDSGACAHFHFGVVVRVRVKDFKPFFLTSVARLLPRERHPACKAWGSLTRDRGNLDTATGHDCSPGFTHHPKQGSHLPSCPLSALFWGRAVWFCVFRDRDYFDLGALILLRNSNIMGLPSRVKKYIIITSLLSSLLLLLLLLLHYYYHNYCCCYYYYYC